MRSNIWGARGTYMWYNFRGGTHRLWKERYQYPSEKVIVFEFWNVNILLDSTCRFSIFFSIFYCDKIHIRFTVSAFLIVQFSGLSTFTVLCTHHHYASPDLFHELHQKVCTLNNNPSPPAATILLSTFMNLTNLGASYKWNYIISVLSSGLFHFA